ncbi:MAG: glutamate-1-semialdehyde-2,1-aminomutase [Elusimicrobia bacterium GWA2_69_24]|nr:MAG: glutamate-1-semialdehyde-2,1-aminomutase [Elusimicrobia bacterium GWA2_69_24]HBL16019.1 glutamate-1-semialdehyde-2,1-aminomutase [Elusimicrobiota bacterium]
MKRSIALFREAKKVLVGGVNSPVRAFRAVEGDPIFVRSGKGARFTDADGKSYLDYCLSWGPMILGHAHPEVVAAATAAMRKGSSFGAPTELEVRLASEVRRALPSMERLRFTSSGTEAVMSALRVARAHTGRDLIVKFVGGYHGHADSLLVAAGSGAATLGRPDSAGVPIPWAKTTLLLPYNDLEAVHAIFKRFGREIAAVIVEPVAANMGVVPPREGFLETLRSVTRKYRSLLIFDEVITGFRLYYGGAQTANGIKPDLTCLGKIIGGGFPVGAYGGRRGLMELVAPVGPVYQAGTLSGNPVAMAAGLKTLEVLKREKPYAALAQRTAELAGGIRQLAGLAGIPVSVNHVASMFTVFFAPGAVSDFLSAKTADTRRYARFFHSLLADRVYFPPSQFEAAMLSVKHRSSDIDRTLDAVARAFKRI